MQDHKEVLVKRITVKEAASLLRCNVETVKRHIARGNIQAARLTPRGPLLILERHVEEALRYGVSAQR